MNTDDLSALTVTTTSHADGVLVAVSGEVDMDNADAFRAALLTSLESSRAPVALRVDMSGVPFCDSMGLKALLAVRTAAVQRGAAFDIVAASDQVQHLLEIVGLPSTLHADPANDADGPPDTR